MNTPTQQKCPFNPGPAPSTSDMPARIARLPSKGQWPVPWFVDKIDGEFDFRFLDGQKLKKAIKHRLCWICGEILGKYQSFVLGPMCSITRTNAEPPSHKECATYAARHCPFLVRPAMGRREDELTEAGTCAGIGLKRNPGCCAVWTTTTYKVFPDRNGKPLLRIGDPVSVEWYAEGRMATRAEVMASIESGIPLLMEGHNPTPEDLAALAEARAAAEQYLPKEEAP